MAAGTGGICIVRIEKFQTVVQLMDKRAAYIAVELTKLGKPLFTPSLPTAGVTVVNNRLYFLFGTEFFDSLSPVQLVGVVVHEALHVIAGHVFEMNKYLDSFNRHLYNIACDAVVNDIIGKFYPDVELPGEHITGKQVIGMNAAHLTAEQVYEMLKRKKPEQLAQFVVLTTLDDHDVWAETGEDGKEQSAKLLEHVRSVVDDYIQVDSWGWQAARAVRSVLPMKPRFDLQRLLMDKISQRLLYETVWTQPSRKLSAVYPQVLLPALVPTGNRLDVLLALDASGSIDRYLLSVFAAIARKRIENTRIEAVTFDTEVYPFDLRQEPRGGGGTSFACIERHALSREKYPDLVIVFTDGWAARPVISQPQRWIWCVPEYGHTTTHNIVGCGEVIRVPV